MIFAAPTACRLTLLDSDSIEMPSLLFLGLSTTGLSDEFYLKWATGDVDWPGMYHVGATISDVADSTLLLSGAVQLYVAGTPIQIVSGTTVNVGHLLPDASKALQLGITLPSGFADAHGFSAFKITFQPAHLPVLYGAREVYPVRVGGNNVMERPTYKAELQVQIITAVPEIANARC